MFGKGSKPKRPGPSDVPKCGLGGTDATVAGPSPHRQPEPGGDLDGEHESEAGLETGRRVAGVGLRKEVVYGAYEVLKYEVE
jgi:hypothetical protein